MADREMTNAELADFLSSGSEVAVLRLKRLQVVTWLLAAATFGGWLFWGRAQGGLADHGLWTAALLLIVAAGFLRREVRRRDRVAMEADRAHLEGRRPPG